MVANAREFPRIYEKALPAPPINIITPVQHDNGDITHGEAMTKQEDAELKELVHQVAASVSLLIKAQSQAQPANGSKWTGWIQTGVICAMLLVSGTNTFKSSESSLAAQITEAKTQAADARRAAEDAAKEAKRANLNNAMLDTYNRELERALIKKGIALPSYPILQK